jgi:hypothetical protein
VQQEIYQKRLTGFPRGCKDHYLPKPLESRSVMDWGSIRALTRKAQLPTNNDQLIRSRYSGSSLRGLMLHPGK